MNEETNLAVKEILSLVEDATKGTGVVKGSAALRLIRAYGELKRNGETAALKQELEINLPTDTTLTDMGPKFEGQEHITDPNAEISFATVQLIDDVDIATYLMFSFDTPIEFEDDLPAEKHSKPRVGRSPKEETNDD